VSRLGGTLVVFAALVSAALAAEKCTLSDKDKASAQQVPAMYIAAWRSSDSEARVMALMTEDAVILPAHGTPPKSGAQAVRDFWFPKNSPPFTILGFTMVPQGVSGCGEIVELWGTQTLEWKMNDKPQITSQGGTFLMVLRRAKGSGWKIKSLMWDDYPDKVR